LRQGDRR